MSEIIDRGAVVIVYTTETDEGVRRVIGYSVSEPAKQVLHWLYIKRDHRGQYNGEKLLLETVKNWPISKDKPWQYSYRTNASTRFLALAPHRFVWKPVTARVKG